MTMKGFNWMALSAAFALVACDTKDGDTGTPGFDTTGDADADADTDADADADADDTPGAAANFDQMFVDFAAVFEGGELADGAYTYTNPATGAVEDFAPTVTFTFRDGDNFAATPTPDYECIVTYDLAAIATPADFSTISGGEDTYMGFDLDTGAVTPEYAGDCDTAAFQFGATQMGDFINSGPWGFGYGPMTSDFEDEVSEIFTDWAELGDKPGASYLKWQNLEGIQVTAWGVFLAFAPNDENFIDTSLDNAIAGVRDSATPPDGLYRTTTVYVIGFSPA